MASLLDWLGKRAKGVVAEINPFDNGESYQTVVNNAPKAAPQRPQQQARPQPQQVSQPSFNQKFNPVSFNPGVAMPKIQAPKPPLLDSKGIDRSLPPAVQQPAQQTVQSFDEQRLKQRDQIQNSLKNQQTKGVRVDPNAVGRFLIGENPAKLINQGFGVAEKFGVNVAGEAQKFLGDKVGGEKTIREGVKSIDDRLLKPGSGFLKAGGLYNSSEALSKADLSEVTRKTGGATLETAANIIPVAKGLTIARKSSPVVNKVVQGSVQGAIAGGVANTGGQIVEGGNFDPMEVIKSVGVGTVLGGGIPAVGAGVSRLRNPSIGTSVPGSVAGSPTLRQIEQHPVQTRTQTNIPPQLQQGLAPTLQGISATPNTSRMPRQQLGQAVPEIQPNIQNRTSNEIVAQLPTYNTQKVGKLDKMFRSTRSIIERQGESGKLLARGLQSARDTQELYLGDLQKAMPTVTRIARKGKNALVNKDFENFVDAAQGLAEPKNPMIAQAVSEWKATHPGIRERAVGAGLEVGDLGPDYYPHFIDYDEVFKNTSTFNKALNHLVTTGQAKTHEEAVQLLNYAKDVSRNREFGNLEASRMIDLPFYDKTPNSLISYLNGSAKRIANTETFGAKDEGALKLIANIGKEGGDTEAAKNAFDVAIGAKKYNDSIESTSRNIRKYVTTTRLGLSALTNTSQNVNTGIVTGHLRTLASMVKQLSPKTREFVADTGVISDALLNDMRTQKGVESFSSKVVGKLINKVTAPGFGIVEKFNRSVAATAGRDYALRLAQKGDYKTLQKLGVTGKIEGKTLTDAQQVQAARKIVEKTQFKVDPQDLPGWVDTPGGKMVAQFRTFSYNQGKFFSNEVLKPAAKGNLLPLSRVMAALPLGYALYETRRAIDGRPEEEDKVKVGLQSFSKIGGAGLALDIYQSLNPVGGKYLPSDRRVSMAVSAIGGPTAGIATQAAGAISEAAQQKTTPEDAHKLEGKVAIKNGEGDEYRDLTPLSRFALTQVPIAGTPLANRYLPYKKESEAATGTLASEIKSVNTESKDKTKALKEAVGKDTYEISNLSTNEKLSLIDSGKLTQKQIDDAEESVSTKRVELGITKAKKVETYADKYTEAQKEFKKDGAKWSPIEKIKKNKELYALSVKKDFDNDTVDLYNMNKTDVFNFVSKDKTGEKRVADILKYGDALVAAGITKTNKFRDKYGNVKLDDGSKKSGGKRGGKGGKKGGNGKKGSVESFAKVLEASRTINSIRPPKTTGAPSFKTASAVDTPTLQKATLKRYSGRNGITPPKGVRVKNKIA